jgi:uncharacterized integral membrane protein (TIGR00698 family)
MVEVELVASSGASSARKLAVTWDRYRRLLPGLGLAAVIGVAAWLVQRGEEVALGVAVIEGLVVAILLGMLWRNAFGVGPAASPGVSYTAREVLEFAIVVLGASVDLPALLRAGPQVLLAIVVAVVVGITASTTIGRTIGLPRKLAILVAVGGSICGNSAIAAVAPVIDADAKDVATSIALTAVVGVAIVLTLPLLIPILGLSFFQYGVLAGMTVYAVPQVVAATFSVSALSGEVGTLVKLVRVLMLGPVVLALSLLFYRETRAGHRPGFKLTKFVPWFIIGFVVLATLRSTGLMPVIVAEPLRDVSRWLMLAAMAALGLGVDIRTVRSVGPSVAVAVVGSFAVLLAVSIALIFGLGIGMG